MRRFLPSLAVATTVLWLSAFPQAAGRPPFGARQSLTLVGPANLIGNVPVLVGKPDDTLTSAGRTDASGAMSYSETILFGKPKIDVAIIRCQGQTPELTVQLWSTGAGQNATTPPNCSKNRVAAYADWGGPIVIKVLVILGAAPATGAQASDSSFWHSPWPYVIGGGIIGGSAAAIWGGGSSGSATPATTTVPTFASVVLHTFGITITVTSSTSCFSPTPSTGTLAFSGNQTATVAVITGLPNAAGASITLNGTTTQNATAEAFGFSGSGSVATPSGGTGGATENLAFGTNSVSGTGTIFNGCGTATTSLTGTVTALAAR